MNSNTLKAAKQEFESRYIGIRECAARYSLSRSTLYRYIQRGLFPKPARIGASMRWDVAVCDAFMADCQR